MTNEEEAQAIEILIRIDKYGNDGADIHEFEELEKFLIDKYGHSVTEKIFLAYNAKTNNKQHNKQLETKYMAGINFDATTVAPNVGFAPVEKGKYTVIMSDSEFKPTSNGAGKLLAITTIVQGGPNHGRSIMFNLNWENTSAKAVEIGKGQFSAICHACNVLRVQDTQQLHNIPFSLEVDVTPDGKYNEVVGIFPIQQQQVMQQPVQQAYQQPQQQFAQPNIQAAGPYAGYQQPTQPPQQVYQQPVAQPQPQVMQQPVSGAANPMAQYEQMAQPQQQFVQQVPPVSQPANDVPDWIKNQMAAQQAAQPGPMGNG